MKTLNFIRSLLQPALTQPTIESYGQTTSNVPPHEIQSVIEWLVSSLLQGATNAPKALCGKGFVLPPSPGNLELIDNKTDKVGTAVPVIAYIW